MSLPWFTKMSSPPKSGFTIKEKVDGPPKITLGSITVAQIRKMGRSLCGQTKVEIPHRLIRIGRSKRWKATKIDTIST